MPDRTQPFRRNQDYVGDPRNDTSSSASTATSTPRAEAKVSVFDSGFVLGDGVWEGLRLVDGRIAFSAAISTGCGTARRCCESTSA